MLADAVKAFALNNLSLAFSLKARGQGAIGKSHEFAAEMTHRMSFETGDNLQAYLELIYVARYLEQIAGLCANIREDTVLAFSKDRTEPKDELERTGIHPRRSHFEAMERLDPRTSTCGALESCLTPPAFQSWLNINLAKVARPQELPSATKGLTKTIQMCDPRCVARLEFAARKLTPNLGNSPHCSTSSKDAASL